MSKMEYFVSAKLGGRFTLIWDMHNKCIKHSGLGAPYCSAAFLKIGLESGGHSAFMPFGGDLPQFSSVEHRFGANWHSWKGYMAQTGLELEMTVTSPFYPQDKEISTLPVFYIELKVRQHKDFLRQNQQLTGSYAGCKPSPRGKLIFDFVKDGLRNQRVCGKGISFEYEQNVWQIDPTWNDIAPEKGIQYSIPSTVNVEESICCDNFASINENGFTFEFDLDSGKNAFDLVWASYCGGKLIESFDGPSKLSYTADFAGVEAVLDYAREHKDRIIKLSQAFDSVIESSSLGKSFSDFFAHSFGWYLANTWWLVNRDGKEWFTVTEGKCLFLSTVDVEYNIAPIYFAFWPDLLRLQLKRWTYYITQENYLCHDLGRLPDTSHCYYPHAMQCEENSNFLLMLSGYLTITKNYEFARSIYGHITDIVKYLIAADTTGNGFVDSGTANTFDDAPASVQFASENVYLSVKVYVAICFACELARKLEDFDLQGRCNDFKKKFEQNFEHDAWAGDHYRVFVPRSGAATTVYKDDEGALVGRAGNNQSSAHNAEILKGSEANCPYTANAFFYADLCGIDHKLDVERLRMDLLASYKYAASEYGCMHSSEDKEHGNVWVSQNIWRDGVAAYLGVDLSNELWRYMNFQRFANSGGLNRGFIDTYGLNNLHSYPRGMAVCSWFFAFSGASYKDEWGFRAVKAPLRLPLPFLADWQSGKMAWFVSFLDKSGVCKTEVIVKNLFENSESK